MNTYVVLKSVLANKSDLNLFLSASLVHPVLELNSWLAFSVVSYFPLVPQLPNPGFSTMPWHTASQ